MTALNMFMRLSKVDEAKRLVSGILSAEVADKSGEIMDYESGKPEFEKWSKDAEKRSGGKSLGNVRAMHGNVAAGKLTQLICDDATKTVEGTAKIVDDAEWKKVLEGVYTGFSIGGSYKKKWKDPENAELTRFTPELSEVSIVDNPCVAEAVFELIRANGASEMRKFKSEPVIEAPSQVWLAKDGSTHAKKEDAIKKNKEIADAAAIDSNPAFDAVRKLEEAVAGLEIDPMTLGKKEFSDERRKHLAETGAALPDGSFPIEDEQDLKNAIHAYGRAGDKDKAKRHIISRAKSLGHTDLLPENWHKDGKGDHKEEGEKSLKGRIKKGLHEVARGACLIEELNWLATCVEMEQMMEEDESTQPNELKHIITMLCTWLENAVEEECREIVEPHAVDLMEAEMALAARLPEDQANALIKRIMAKAGSTENFPYAKPAIVEALQKAGARHSKSDMTHLAEMKEHHEKLGKALDGIGEAHEGLTKYFGKAAGDKEAKEHLDNLDTHHAKAERAHDGMEKCMSKLGYEKSAPSEDMQKMIREKDEAVIKLTADNEGLKKSLDAMITTVESLTKRVEQIAAQPLPARGSLYAVNKGHELNPSGTEPTEAVIHRGEPDRSPVLSRI